MARKTKADIEAEIQRLQDEKKKLEEKEVIRLGRLAAKAGLLDVTLSDAAILDAMKVMAARFRQQAHDAPAATDSADRADAIEDA